MNTLLERLVRATFIVCNKNLWNSLYVCEPVPSVFIYLEIIPLQPTRKEINWETEEAMEKAAVTLETERVKWPSPGCL